MNDIKPNLTNVNRGIEMIKYEVYQQDQKIKHLEYNITLKEQQILRLESQLADLEKKYATVFRSFSKLTDTVK